MINNYQYDKLTDEMVVVQHEENPNYYYIKNKLDETDAIVIGHINYKEDNFYATFKSYVDLNREDLIAIAEYMDGLEKVEGDFPEVVEEKPAAASPQQGIDPGMLMSMFGGGMPIQESEDLNESEEILDDASATENVIEAEYEEEEKTNE